jgi:hypothetical protein
MTGHVRHVREVRNSYKIVVGNPEGKGQLGETKCRWEDNIEINLQEVG